MRDETRESLLDQGLEREEVLKRVRERKPTLEELTPLMRAFDYPAAWLAPYRPDREKPNLSENTHTRDYVWSLMEELEKRYPELWENGRLSLIPHGDVLLALDRKMRAGEVPGIENIGFFSREGGHVRAGLPRYTLGATIFAVLYGEHPRVLDYAIYNDLENYTNENVKKLGMGGYVHQPDLGVLLEITPERARIVNDTIWEVVTRHPHVRLP